MEILAFSDTTSPPSEGLSLECNMESNRYIVLYRTSAKSEYKPRAHLYSSERLAQAPAEIMVEEGLAVKAVVITVEGVEL